MFSASQHPGFASAVVEQRVAAMRQQAADHKTARAAKAHGTTSTKSRRRAVRFVRAFAHS